MDESLTGWSATEVVAPAPTPPVDEPPRRRRLGGVLLLGLGALGLLAAGAAGYALFGPGSGDDADPAETAEVGSGAEVDPAEEIALLLQGIGYDGVDIEVRDGTVFVSGAVGSQADVAAVVTASASLARGLRIDAEQLTVGPAAPESSAESAGQDPTPQGPATVRSDPLQQLQVALGRAVAAKPIIFEPGTSSIESWQTETLDQVADLLAANPGIAVTVVGHTDDSGRAEANRALSEERASAVRGYLVDQGIDPGLIQTDARGESESSGVLDVGYLERRVEFEVVAVSLTPVAALPLEVGLIVPSARDDLAFSQSLVDALAVLGDERGGLTVDVSENMFDVDAARARAEQYIDQGADVVFLHGSQFRPFVEELALASPDVVFVAGPSPLESDLPNVFVYTIAAEQGAYVLGDLAASLSASGTVGVVGPVPAPEPQRFVEGFRLGAEQNQARVLAEYVGSFNDVEAATGVAEAHVAAGADALTGTAQLVVGPIEVAQREGLLWFANQANPTSLAPDNVVASQVYHFEVAIREILAEIDAGSTTGGTFPLTLGNGGMLLEFNPDFPLDQQLRRRADDLLFGVTAGSIQVDVDVDE